MARTRGGVRAAAGVAGALGGAALTPFVVAAIPDVRCDDTVTASCAARQPTLGWLVLCAVIGCAVGLTLAAIATRDRS